MKKGGPFMNPRLEARHTTKDKVGHELQLNLIDFVICSDIHVRLDNDGQHKIENQDVQHQQVKNRVQHNVVVVCPVLRELPEQHLELGLHGVENGAEVVVLGPKPPARNPGEHQVESHHQEDGVPHVVQAAADGS
eukprot:CAMPEP_0196571774 /NCGR_PEP_ID=MMETSP1081-20130531/1906_1 /TAXON_ID=36882 /ORGANISM="Pyramimonas amylifera, Strain CCMP720" /LENGTH=134 /DNA_ID=CAMNT_0041888837 /DNA_START=235 /DNA_END=636 /DNA_ORIENTATION=-